MSINLKSSIDRADSLDWLRDESFRDWTAFNDEQHVLSRWIQKCSLKMEVNSPYEYLTNTRARKCIDSTIGYISVDPTCKKNKVRTSSSSLYSFNWIHLFYFHPFQAIFGHSFGRNCRGCVDPSQPAPAPWPWEGPGDSFPSILGGIEWRNCSNRPILVRYHCKMMFWHLRRWKKCMPVQRLLRSMNSVRQTTFAPFLFFYYRGLRISNTEDYSVHLSIDWANVQRAQRATSITHNR